MKDKLEYIAAMALIEQVSAKLDTVAYIWGGLTIDIYEGRFLREHSDIDYFIVDLQRLSARFGKALLCENWDVKTVLNGHLLVARKDGIKLHLGNVEIDDVVNWRHNGDSGTITFPASWLREHLVDFCGVQVHIVEPELGYVLKTNPDLMNPEWKPREKDKLDIKPLEKILVQKGANPDLLCLRVNSVSS